MYIRLLSLAFGLSALLAPPFIGVYAAKSFGPTDPIRWGYILTFLFIGLGLSLGYFCVAFLGNRIAFFPRTVRYLLALLLALPLLLALYFVVGTHAPTIAAMSVFVSIYTAWLCILCLWPSSNLSFKPQGFSPISLDDKSLKRDS